MSDIVVVLLHSARFIPRDVLDYLSGLAPSGYRLEPLDQDTAGEQRRAAFAEAEYIFAYPGNPSADDLACARRLKLFQLLSAGHDWLDIEAFRRAGVPLASNDGSNAVSTAEHAVLLMLAALRQLPRHHVSTAAGDWLAMKHTMELREMRGQRVGLVGFGNVARNVARRIRGFEAAVRYSKPLRAPAALEQSLQVEFRELDDLLAESDIVSLHLPLSTQTRGLIDSRALQRMKPGSYLVNTARGALVDEDALVDALTSGHLAGAGLDVFAHEPVDSQSPLLRLPNVVLTPHLAGCTRDAWLHRITTAWDNVRRVAAGLPPLSRVA